jgi:hypothetical protein
MILSVVTLFFQTPTPGTYDFTLRANVGTCDGPLIGTSTTPRALNSNMMAVDFPSSQNPGVDYFMNESGNCEPLHKIDVNFAIASIQFHDKLNIIIPTHIEIGTSKTCK